VIILSSHYLPCLEWFNTFLRAEQPVIDLHEHFVKQTYRNRTSILSANGRLALTVPVRKTAHHMPMLSVEIENDFRWQHQHWHAIKSAYSSAPYFLYYHDHFERLYTQEFTHLTTFNNAVLEVCLKIMKTAKVPVSSSEYLVAQADDTDTRALISPKKASGYEGKEYLQVFSEKFPFEKNLGILDLLFNHGPQWRQYL
jgi:hypothetical protein